MQVALAATATPGSPDPLCWLQQLAADLQPAQAAPPLGWFFKLQLGVNVQWLGLRQQGQELLHSQPRCSCVGTGAWWCTCQKGAARAAVVEL